MKGFFWIEFGFGNLIFIYLFFHLFKFFEVIVWPGKDFMEGNTLIRTLRIVCLNACVILHIFSSVQFSHWVVSNSVALWTTACQASLSITSSQSLLKLMSIESVIPSNHLILCCPLLLLHQGLFKWVSSFHHVAKVLEFQLQHQSFQWTPRTDLL